MEPTTSVSLVQLGGLMIGLVILAAIFLIAALMITRRRKPSVKKTKPAEAKRPAAQPTTSRIPAQRTPRPPTTGTVRAPVQDPAPPGAVEAMRIYRQADDSLIIQIEDQQYRTLGDIRQAGIEKPFLAILRELARIAKETGGQVTHTEVTAPPESESIAAAPPPPPSPPITPVPSMEELTATFGAANDSQPMGTFFGNMRRMIPGSPSEADMNQPPGIADQIEAVLQLKLLSSEEYRGQRIHVRAAPGGGVQIEVGDNLYEAVGDIEDDGIRAFIQSAIQDWDRQQG